MDDFGIDLSALTFAQLVALTKAVNDEKSCRWRAIAEAPHTFKDVAEELATEELRLIVELQWRAQTRDGLAEWEKVVNGLIVAELERRGWASGCVPPPADG